MASSYSHACDSTLRWQLGAKLDEISKVKHVRVSFTLVTWRYTSWRAFFFFFFLEKELVRVFKNRYHNNNMCKSLVSHDKLVSQ